MSSSRTGFSSVSQEHHLRGTEQCIWAAMADRGVRRTGALDVADDASGRVVHEFDAHLCDTATGTWQCQQMPHPSNIPPTDEEIVVVEVEHFDVPVRPRTRVTLTSLTGTFDESMIAVEGVRDLWV